MQKNLKLFTRVVLPLLLIIYISYETWLKLHHTSLCSATGCKLAGELLKFPSIYLNYLGIGAVFAILILGILSIRNRAFDKLYFIALFSAIAFESIMIGYQILANPEPCIFCLGVYSSLLLIAIFSNLRFFIYFLPVIFSIFFALNDLAIPKNDTLINNRDGLYLISSKTCPHCKRVKAFLKENSISYTNISANNPSARYLAKFLAIDKIPILFKREGIKTTIIYGDRAIIDYLKSKKEDSKSSSNSANIDIFKESSQGCSLSPLSSSSGGCQEPTEKLY